MGKNKCFLAKIKIPRDNERQNSKLRIDVYMSVAYSYTHLGMVNSIYKRRTRYMVIHIDAHVVTFIYLNYGGMNMIISSI